MPRILTYNVHRCVGTDRRLDVGRVANVIAGLEPDIVA
ncbi:MAG TPA: EEP domain-containing protein, partial [Phenylobacterium sp.]|nr:EEP domain-containing protein [Phenylobacterium sp.]